MNTGGYLLFRSALPFSVLELTFIRSARITANACLLKIGAGGCTYRREMSANAWSLSSPSRRGSSQEVT